MTPFSLFLCARCLGKNKEFEGQLPENELWELFRTAYQQYQLHIIQGDKTYHRYVNDLISYHVYTGATEEHVIRSHIQNVSKLHELLTTRMDLVEDFFGKDSFSHDDYCRMDHLFNTTSHTKQKPSIIASFNWEQCQIIADFANENNLFVNKVDVQILMDFFRCELKRTLYVPSSTPILLMLNALSYNSWLSYNWQLLIAEHQLLGPSSTMKPFSQSAISSRLSDAVKKQSSPLVEPYGSLIKKLQETL